MTHALFKISWTTTANGLFAGEAVGGICGTCFTLRNGKTFTSLALTDGLFEPTPGYDAFRVFVAGKEGWVREVVESQLGHLPMHGLSVLTGLNAPHPMTVASPENTPHTCTVVGYVTDTAPFETVTSPSRRHLEIIDINLERVTQSISAAHLCCAQIDLNSEDHARNGVDGFLIDAPRRMSIGGAPVLNSDGKVLGVCVQALPADEPMRIQLGAVDIRRIPSVVS